MSWVAGGVIGFLAGAVCMFVVWMFDKEREQDKFSEMWWDDHHPTGPLQD